jgi:hypothetical protein
MLIHKMLKGRRRPCRIWVPVLVGGLYFLLSIPFLLDVLTPSIHEGNSYSTLFVLVNLPWILLMGSIGDMICRSLFETQTLYKSNMVFLMLTWLMWVILAFAVGVLIDLTRRRRPK